MKDRILPYLSLSHNFSYVVICGLAKTGTSLPLFLLDSHPQLTVFPEELRFMDTGCQNMKQTEGLTKLLANHNIQQFKINKATYSTLAEHLGTGCGERDYSEVNFDIFCEAVTIGFEFAENTQQRYFSIFLALEIARGGDYESLKPVLVSKAPHNELFMASWQRMLGNKAHYIWMVRDPVEHYFSYNKTLEVSNACLGVQDYISLLNSRFALMELQTSPTIFIRYEDLVEDLHGEVNTLAQFLSIDFDKTLLSPTKNGIPWLGNSSRGIRGERVFANPLIARSLLPNNIVQSIENETQNYMHVFNYDT